MSLKNRLGIKAEAEPVPVKGQAQGRSKSSAVNQNPERDSSYQRLKGQIHYRVLEMMDLSVLSTADDDLVEREMEQAVLALLEEESISMSRAERDTLVGDIRDEVLGLGPLEPLLADESISEIMCNGPRRVYVERSGRLVQSTARFRDDAHLLKIIDKIATAVGRRIDESSPMVDARLSDGSRVNAIIGPLALDGPSLTIRKFSKDPLQVSDLIRFGSINPAAARVMEAVVAARLNVIISGGTGSGKTTLLNVFSSFIPARERIVTVEDSAELQLQQDHIVRLETRPPNIEGSGEVTMRDLVKNCLRMRPDRIVVGEVRGGEALDMIQAMSTGHDGSLTTLHANNPRDCLARLETLISMGGLDISEKAIRRQIASAVDVIVQVSRLEDGSRKVTSFTEVTGMESDVVTLQEIFKFEQTGLDASGKALGRFEATGVRPQFSGRLKASGIELPSGLFAVNRSRARA